MRIYMNMRVYYLIICVVGITLLSRPTVKNHLQGSVRWKREKFLNFANLVSSASNNTVLSKKSSDLFNGCVLPKFDPFDASVKKHINLNFNKNYRKSCRSDFQVLTTLSNGKVSTKVPTMKCKARCFNGGENYVKGAKEEEFKNIEEASFDCEFVEVHCLKSESSKSADYAMLHTQIIPKNNTRTRPSKKQHNVYVFLLDSVSTYSAARYLPKTLRYLENSMSGVQFPFVNRVGLNSRPNGLALFYGKSIENVERTPMGMETELADWEWWSSCNRYLDNETSIFHEYRDMGYQTMMTNDWTDAQLVHPNCKGVKEHVMDHVLGTSFVMKSKTKEQKQNYHGNNCLFFHNVLLDYTKKFRNAYPDRPIFAWNWFQQIIHENQSGPQVLDEDIVNFLYENKEEMDNSFVFFLSDHGCRGCSITQTEMGKMEFSNPFFAMAVPKTLRTPEILGILKENAGKLQTQFDSRATMLDILKYQPNSDFADREPFKIPGEKGNSYLRRQVGERSCRTLPIPFAYCICQYPMEKLDTKSKEVTEAGKAVVDAANQRLKDNGLDKKCNLWKFSKVESVTGFAPVNQTRSMKIVVALGWPYSKARFVGLVHRAVDGPFSISELDRIDTYWQRGSCAPGPLQPLCDCK